jgi:hypothetical protein
VGGSGPDPVLGIISVFSGWTEENLYTLVSIVGLHAEIWTQDVQNTKHGC